MTPPIALALINIISLFIRPYDFKETKFAIHERQGLPGYENAKMRWIVSSEFSNRDEGYQKIVEGVKATSTRILYDKSLESADGRGG